MEGTDCTFHSNRVMKSRNNVFKIAGSFIGWIFLVILFSSCSFYNFSQPQPYDQKNLYRFPDCFLGKWVETDTFTSDIEFTVPLNQNSGLQSSDKAFRFNQTTQSQDEGDYGFYYISKHYVILVLKEEEKLVKEAWPKYQPGKGYSYLPGRINSFQKIQYDSINKPVDTVDRYIIRGKLIFEKNENGYLDRGYPYKMINDTIVINKLDSIYIDLGQNAFLRKLNDSNYVFNFHQSSLLGNDGGAWWNIIILQSKGKKQFYQWECNSSTANLSCMFYARPSRSNQFYFDCRWSTADMLTLMNKNYFDKTVFNKQEK